MVLTPSSTSLGPRHCLRRGGAGEIQACQHGPMASLSFTVGPDDTAAVLGSGDLDVLGTPRLLAWAEAATCAALADELDPGSTSVGTRVSLEHLRGSTPGEQVTVDAEVTHRDGRLVRFQVTATDSRGRLVGQGEVTRVVVDRERFLSRL
jgi:fluoroacetyl-CoA thioesterase